MLRKCNIVNYTTIIWDYYNTFDNNQYVKQIKIQQIVFNL